MANAKKAGEFSFKATSVAYVLTEDGGGANHLDLDGTATGYGEVLGTLSLFGDGPMAQSGPASWVGTALPGQRRPRREHRVRASSRKSASTSGVSARSCAGPRAPSS